MLTLRVEYKDHTDASRLSRYKIFQAEHYEVTRIEVNRPPEEMLVSNSLMPAIRMGGTYWRTEVQLWNKGVPTELLYTGECEEVRRIFVMNDAGKTVDTIQ